MNVNFLPQAIEELDSSIQYYEDLCAGLGVPFKSEVQKAITLIELMPTTWQVYDDGTRRLNTDKFPFTVVYFIHNETIWIVAVAHHKQFPNYWFDRL